MKVNGFRKISERFFLVTFVKNLWEPKILIAKIGFLSVKIKRPSNISQTFPQRFDNVILLPGLADIYFFMLHTLN